MSLTTFLIISAGILALLFFIKIESFRKEKAIENAFSGRESHSPEEFYNKFFKDQNIPEYIVYGIKEILEEQLDADLSRLVDEDDFSKNLNFFWDFDSMADVELIIALEGKFNIQIEDTEAEQTLTVRDIVNLVWNKRHNLEAPS
jgi:acyl carrier protein